MARIVPAIFLHFLQSLPASSAMQEQLQRKPEPRRQSRGTVIETMVLRMKWFDMSNNLRYV